MSVQCNLIIDSCCDLPFNVVDQEGIALLQFPYIVEEDQYLDDLYEGLSAHDFFEKMRKGAAPTTAQIPIVRMNEVFEKACLSGVPTVYLAFSSMLSGNFNTAEMIVNQMKEKYPDAELYLVDTKLASIAEALLVSEAIKQRDKGMSAQDLVAWVEEARYFVNSEFMVDDLTSLRRGGRIPHSVAFAGAKLDVKPLLTFDLEGNLTLTGVARGRKKGLRLLAEYYEKHNVDGHSGRMIIVGDADCPKDITRLKENVIKEDEGAFFLETKIGPVIGSHVGPGMIAISFWGEDRRNDLSVADRIARKVKNSHEE